MGACSNQSWFLPLASIGTWGWGWKSRKGNREKVLRHKNHLSVIFYCHVILAKPFTFPTYTVTNAMRPSLWWWWGRGGGREGVHVPLFPLKKMALFLKNTILVFYVPCSPQLPNVPLFPLFLGLCSPEKNALVPLFPKTPGRVSVI